MLKSSSLTVSGGPNAQTHLDSSRRTGGAQKAIKCPECQVVLTAQNLKSDAALVRKIRRIQAAAQEEQDEDSDPEPTGGNARGKATQRQHISSSPGPAVGGMSQSQRVKREMVVGGSRAVSMVPGTQIGGRGEDDSYEMVGETQIEGSEGEGEREEEGPSGTAEVVSMDEEAEEDEEEEEEE